jgi:hypothetical protein
MHNSYTKAGVLIAMIVAASTGAVTISSPFNKRLHSKSKIFPKQPNPQQPFVVWAVTLEQEVLRLWSN